MDRFEDELLDELRAIRTRLDNNKIEIDKKNRELKNGAQKIRRVMAIVVILFALGWLFEGISGCLQREIEIRQHEAVIFGR